MPDDRRRDPQTRAAVRRAASSLRGGATPRAVLGGLSAHVAREEAAADLRAKHPRWRPRCEPSSEPAL